jgi:hypothetical protein
MWALKEKCSETFECTQGALSTTQQQISETLRHMGLSVEDEVCCPKSGYSMDMIVHDCGRRMGGESRRSACTWAVELMALSTFLASRSVSGRQRVPPC